MQSGGLQGFFGQVYHPDKPPGALKLAMPVASMLNAQRAGVFHVSNDSFPQCSFIFLSFNMALFIRSLLLGQPEFEGNAQSLLE